MAIKPTRPDFLYAIGDDWKRYADALEAYRVEREREISKALRNHVDSETANVVRAQTGLPAVPRNDLYTVIVTRFRVRASSATDAADQVRIALAGVSFTDRSDVRRNFRFNTTVTASKVAE